MNTKEEIVLKLKLEEVKVIMSALAKLPFENVYEVIGKINDQTNAQMLSKK